MKTLTAVLIIGITLISAGCVSKGLLTPENRSTENAKAVATIASDTNVKVVRQATSLPPIAATMSGSNNILSISVPVSTNTATVTTSADTNSRSSESGSTDNSTKFTAGQKLLLLAIGIGAICLVVGIIIWYFKRQFPAIGAAIDGLASAVDGFAAKEIQSLRVKMAGALNADAKAAYSEAITSLESTRGVTATERSKLSI